MEINLEKVKEYQELKRLEDLEECCGVKVKRFYIDMDNNLIKYTPTVDEFICKDEDYKKLYFARNKTIIIVTYDENSKPDFYDTNNIDHEYAPFPIGTFELIYEDDTMYRYETEYIILLKYLSGEITKEKVSLVIDLDSIKEVNLNESVEK